MFSIVNSLFGKDSAPPILPELENQYAASAFCTFFGEKTQTIRTGLEAAENSSYSVGETLSEFSPVSEVS